MPVRPETHSNIRFRDDFIGPLQDAYDDSDDER